MSQLAAKQLFPPRFPRIAAALLLFGISFGFVEAAVVAYLRPMYESVRLKHHPDVSPSDLFPLLRLDQIRAEGGIVLRSTVTELVREAATLLLLAAVAMATARSFREGFAAFAAAFGLWDIFFYVFLKAILDWPESLWTWDLLFLLPVPWVGPVIAPVIVSVTMIAAGAAALWRECGGRPLRMAWYHWAFFVAGGLLIFIAFTWDHRNILAGGTPSPFQWPIFWAGEGVGIAGFLLAAAGRRDVLPQ